MPVTSYLPAGLPPFYTSVGLLLGALILHRVCLIVYRVYFHPLAGFPGPRLYAASFLPQLYRAKIQGTFVKDMLQIHDKYGPIVRVSPNHLAIDGSIGWPEVFSRRAHQAEFDKLPAFYLANGRVGLFPSYREDHRRQRRLLAHAFSDAALYEQEEYIAKYVDLLMVRLRERMEMRQLVDITRWFNFTTFDIIGELAFADPFDSLAKSDYHPWVAMIFKGIKANSQILFLMQYPWLRPLLWLLIGNKDIEARKDSARLAREKTEKRLAMGEGGRKDIMTYILRHNSDGKGMTKEEIFVNTRPLIVAGSETTATALSGLAFQLTQNPEVYERLTEEIRTAYSSEEEITMRSTASLPYLHACLEEVLRIYPPAAETPPRVSPGDFVDGKYIPKGTLITIYQWATHHSARNFTDPEKFAPERWLPSTNPLYDARYASDKKGAFKPFSAGPRDCIGKNLAYAEMRLIIARLLWNFDIKLRDGQQDWMSRQRAYVVYDKPPLMVSLSQATRS